MRAGLLRHRVRIEQPVDVADGYGGQTRTWSTAATVWARVELLQGREYRQAAAAAAEMTATILIRHRSGIHSRMRVVWDSRTFEIVSVAADARRSQIELICKEIV